MRVRGLKFFGGIALDLLIRSHPMRVRGLKYAEANNGTLNHAVAPHAGAWIEIDDFLP